MDIDKNENDNINHSHIESLNNLCNIELTNIQYEKIKNYILENLDENDYSKIKNTSQKMIQKLQTTIISIKVKDSIYDYLKQIFKKDVSLHISDYATDFKECMVLYNEIERILSKNYDEDDVIFDFEIDSFILQAIPIIPKAKKWIRIASGRKLKKEYTDKQIQKLEQYYIKYCIDYIKNNFPTKLI
jgi:sugar-specific transcriptional regulator TrmB